MPHINSSFDLVMKYNFAFLFIGSLLTDKMATLEDKDIWKDAEVIECLLWLNQIAFHILLLPRDIDHRLYA